MAVYDDQKEKLKPGSHDDLGVHPERREAEVDDLENLYNAESAPEKKQQNRAYIAGVCPIFGMQLLITPHLSRNDVSIVRNNITYPR